MSGRHQRKKKKGGFKVLLILVIIVAVLFAGYNFWLSNISKPYDANATETIIAFNVPSGSSTGQIAFILEENGIIKSASSFKLLAKIKGTESKFQAGDYSLSPSMSADDIMDSLMSGDLDTFRFTVPEGLTVKETAELLSDAGRVDAEKFMNEAENGVFDFKFIPFLPEGENRLEGFLFPETYDVYVVADEHDIINRMLSQFDLIYKDEYYARATEMGYSLNDIVTIASLIERETRADSERALVASVIYNRLDSGMPLQIDATIQYALGEQKDRLTTADTQLDSPYNTYQIVGLPPGPICSPGEASIIAALYPETTDYYYYVLKPNGELTHNFSNSYAEFLDNKQAYINSL